MPTAILIICAVFILAPLWFVTAIGCAASDAAPGSDIRDYAKKHPKEILNKHLKNCGIFFLIVLGVIIYAFISYHH